MSNTPTLAQLKRGLQISEQIAALEPKLAAIFTGKAPVKASTVKKKGGISAARRARIAAAQKLKWSKIKKAKAPTKKKSKMSAQGLANIIAAQKARWAKIKKAPVPVKKRKPMSAEAKAALSKLMKAKWAAKKAAQAS